MGRLGPLAAILACCGVKLVVLAALLIPAGFLTENTLIGLGVLAVAILLVVLAVRGRRRCDGTCHLPGRRGDDKRTEKVGERRLRPDHERTTGLQDGSGRESKPTGSTT
jgi:hypothetical protein